MRDSPNSPSDDPAPDPAPDPAADPGSEPASEAASEVATKATLKQRAPGIALALLLGTLGGWAASALDLPLPWMIGAMTATTVAAVAGAPIAMAQPLRTVMVAVLGVMLGSGFTPEILARLDEWIVSLLSLFAYIALAGGAGLLYFRRVCGYDPITAYFSAMPGGLSEMIVVGGEMGGDARRISLAHASRLLLVVLTIPFAFRWLEEFEPGSRPAAGLPIASIPPVDLGILALCGLVGFALARAVKVPAAAVVGPMLVSAVVHLAGWTDAAPPVELVSAAQVAVGAAIGARFAGTELRLVLQTLVQSFGATAILVAVTLLFAGGLSLALDLDPRALVLAFAPGGLAEMSLIAIALGADAAFVATHHIVRIVLIVVLAPAAFRLMGWRRPPKRE